MGSSSAPWKQLLLSSIEANSHLKHHSYFQLATVSSNNRPSNRTVVFRGFQDDADKILINTDTRTRKINDLKHCPFAEICWYFTESWEQFRISGVVDVVDGATPDPLKLEQREKSWFASSLRSRVQYVGASPGLPAIASEQSSPSPSLDPSIGPVAAFCLLLFDPHQVDYLNLKSNERLLFTSIASDNGQRLWTSQKIRGCQYDLLYKNKGSIGTDSRGAEEGSFIGIRCNQSMRGQSLLPEVGMLTQEHCSSRVKNTVATLVSSFEDSYLSWIQMEGADTTGEICGDENGRECRGREFQNNMVV